MDLLGAAGIPVIVLKESPFAGLAYDETERRPIADLPFFIRPENAGGAVAVLISRGSPVGQDGQPVDILNIATLYVTGSSQRMIFILQEDR
jgi:hypothetical protein